MNDSWESTQKRLVAWQREGSGSAWQLRRILSDSKYYIRILMCAAKRAPNRAQNVSWQDWWAFHLERMSEKEATNLLLDVWNKDIRGHLNREAISQSKQILEQLMEAASIEVEFAKSFDAFLKSVDDVNTPKLLGASHPLALPGAVPQEAIPSKLTSNNLTDKETNIVLRDVVVPLPPFPSLPPLKSGETEGESKSFEALAPTVKIEFKDLASGDTQLEKDVSESSGASKIANHDPKTSSHGIVMSAQKGAEPDSAPFVNSSPPHLSQLPVVVSQSALQAALDAQKGKAITKVHPIKNTISAWMDGAGAHIKSWVSNSKVKRQPCVGQVDKCTSDALVFTFSSLSIALMGSNTDNSKPLMSIVAQWSESRRDEVLRLSDQSDRNTDVELGKIKSSELEGEVLQELSNTPAEENHSTPSDPGETKDLTQRSGKPSDSQQGQQIFIQNAAVNTTQSSPRRKAKGTVKRADDSVDKE